jgi:hypothetical protein
MIAAAVHWQWLLDPEAPKSEKAKKKSDVPTYYLPPPPPKKTLPPPTFLENFGKRFCRVFF